VNGYEAVEPISDEQETLPDPSVVSFPPFARAEQFAVAIVSPPPTKRIPFAKVEVAVVVPTLRDDTESPPRNVDVPTNPCE
jgi:hypothetical protein